MEGLEQRGEDVLLHVRVQPKASRVKVTVEDGRVRVHVTAPPAEGLANRMVCDAMAKRLDVAKTRVRIHSGDKSREKTLLVEGVKLEEVQAMLGMK